MGFQWRYNFETLDNPSHSFQNPGNYNVNLVITTANGCYRSGNSKSGCLHRTYTLLDSKRCMYWFAYSVLLIRLYLRTEQSLHGTGHLVTAEFLQNATQVTSTQMPEIIPSHWLLLQLTDVMMTCRVMWKFSIHCPFHSKQQCFVKELRFSLSTIL